ncbi:PDZ domain-containing protein [Gemmatimonas sp.]|uniref:PDZ domain-containing protein n=1 Tax=Gemmatimonas sp. TaxID=1962908 RepID=UPI003341EAB3
MNQKSVLFSIAFSSLALSVGCAPSAYSKFYSGALPEEIPGYISTVTPPVIERASDVLDAQSALFRDGFVQIGASVFWADEDAKGISSKELAKFARKLGAQRVVTVRKPRGVVQGADLVLLPTQETTRTNGTIQSGGRTATTTATSRRRGLEPVAIPYSVERSNFEVLYFVKVRLTLGVLSRALTDKERQQVGTNRGVAILAIANASPAFFADLLPGDFLLDFEGQAIQSPEHLSSLLDGSAGKVVTLHLIRSGQPLTKRLTLANRQ